MSIRTIGTAALAAAAIASSAFAGFDGQQVTVNAGGMNVWPDPSTQTFSEVGTPLTAEVGPAVEASSIGLYSSFSVDFTNSTITLVWNKDMGAIRVGGDDGSGANAMWFIDTNDSIPEIVGVSLDANIANPLGLAPQDLAFTANSVLIDLSNTAWQSGRDTAIIHVTFIPTPGAAGLAGIAMLAGLRRRR
jgi:hypothetical protein